MLCGLFQRERGESYSSRAPRRWGHGKTLSRSRLERLYLKNGSVSWTWHIRQHAICFMQLILLLLHLRPVLTSNNKSSLMWTRMATARWLHLNTAASSLLPGINGTKGEHMARRQTDDLGLPSTVLLWRMCDSAARPRFPWMIWLSVLVVLPLEDSVFILAVLTNFESVKWICSGRLRLKGRSRGLAHAADSRGSIPRAFTLLSAERRPDAQACVGTNNWLQTLEKQNKTPMKPEMKRTICHRGANNTASNYRPLITLSFNPSECLRQNLINSLKAWMGQTVWPIREQATTQKQPQNIKI